MSDRLTSSDTRLDRRDAIANRRLRVTRALWACTSACGDSDGPAPRIPTGDRGSQYPSLVASARLGGVRCAHFAPRPRAGLPATTAGRTAGRGQSQTVGGPPYVHRSGRAQRERLTEMSRTSAYRHFRVPCAGDDHAPLQCPTGTSRYQSTPRRRPCPITGVLDHVADKWSIGIIVAAARARFASPKPERGGLLIRTVYLTVPPKVEYNNSPNYSPAQARAERHRHAIAAARNIYDHRPDTRPNRQPPASSPRWKRSAVGREPALRIRDHRRPAAGSPICGGEPSPLVEVPARRLWSRSRSSSGS